MQQIAAIRTARLLLRPPTLADIPRIAALWGDAEVARHIAVAPKDEVWASAYVTRKIDEWARDGFGLYVLEARDGGTFVGHAGLNWLDERRAEIEVGCVLARSCWGLGFATEAVRACLKSAPADRVVALVQPGNDGSIALCARVGLRPFGDVRLHERSFLRFEWRRAPGSRPAEQDG